MVDDLDYEGIKSPVSKKKKNYRKIERQNNICINVFHYENGLAYPVYVSDQKFRDCMDLLLISKENKRKSSKKVLIEHKENCLIING